MTKTDLLKATIVAAGLCLTACQSTSTPVSGQKDQIAEGQYIAEKNCASCHTLAAAGQSPREDAPPLRFALKHTNSDALAEDFREHIHVGHPDMPDFDFLVREVEDLLAYLDSIQQDAPTP